MSSGKSKTIYYQSSAQHQSRPSDSSVPSAPPRQPVAHTIAPKQNKVSYYGSSYPVQPVRVQRPHLGRQEPMELEPELPLPQGIDNTCICNRQSAAIACSNCGFFRTKLQTRKRCPAHPKVDFIMGLQACPSCGSTSLVEEDDN